MSEITIKVEATDLISAMNALANALNANSRNIMGASDKSESAVIAKNQQPADATAVTLPMTAPTAQSYTAPAQSPVSSFTVPSMPPMQVPTAAPVATPTTYAPQTAPVTPTMPMGVPTAPTSAPAYTIEQLQTAIAPLLDAGKVAQIQQLVQSFGVATLMDMPKERYGEFANGLRNLGGVI